MKTLARGWAVVGKLMRGVLRRVLARMRDDGAEIDRLLRAGERQ